MQFKTKLTSTIISKTLILINKQQQQHKGWMPSWKDRCWPPPPFQEAAASLWRECVLCFSFLPEAGAENRHSTALTKLKNQNLWIHTYMSYEKNKFINTYVYFYDMDWINMTLMVTLKHCVHAENRGHTTTRCDVWGDWTQTHDCTSD